MGKSSLLAAIAARAKELSFRVGHGTSAPVEGAWPYAPVVEALADLCRRHPDAARRPPRPPPRRDRPGARRRRDLVDRRELAPAAVRRGGRTRPPGVGHERSAAHHRRRPRRRRRQPAPPALHRPLDARPTGVHRAQRIDPSPMTDTLAETRQSLIDRHGATELELGPLGADDIATLVAPPRRRARRPSWSNRSRRSVGASRSRSTSSPAARPTSRDGCRRSTPT